MSSSLKEKCVPQGFFIFFKQGFELKRVDKGVKENKGNKKELKRVDKGVKENKQNKKESKRVDTGMKKNNRSKKELKGIVKTPVCRP